jgi:hypothetical protein
LIKAAVEINDLQYREDGIILAVEPKITPDLLQEKKKITPDLLQIYFKITPDLLQNRKCSSEKLFRNCVIGSKKKGVNH